MSCRSLVSVVNSAFLGSLRSSASPGCLPILRLGHLPHQICPISLHKPALYVTFLVPENFGVGDSREDGSPFFVLLLYKYPAFFICWGGRGVERMSSHPLLHSPNIYNDWGWAA